MFWYQVAFDPEALDSHAWVVLQMNYMVSGGYVRPVEVGRWPTRHEAEGHARKNWERTGR